MVCGFFFDSLKDKFVNQEYYQKIGVMAYESLDRIVPEFFEVQSFYKNVAGSFSILIEMMSMVRMNFDENTLNGDSYFLVGQEKNSDEK